MKIANSDVTMYADRTYRQYGSRVSDDANDKAQTSEAVKLSGGSFLTKLQNTGTGGSALTSWASPRDQILNNVMKLLFGQSNRNTSTNDLWSAFAGSMISLSPFATTGSTLTQNVLQYSEEESVSFQAKGLAMTEDGRELDFSIDVSMSRGFMQYTQVQVPNPFALMDPLMINVGSAVASVSDQKFFFDLDADGTAEEISYAGQGSGFLALDKNGDGIINDGSELFGALTGDGFAELREYDSDGNGWIDENDEIFHKLKVWYKNGDDEEELVDLLTADIGAIYLGSKETSFDLYGNGGFGDFNARVRATGFFLRESGGSGTVQHVDLAARRPGETSETGEATDDTVGETSSDSLPGSTSGGALIINTAQNETEDTQDTRKTEKTNRTDEAKAFRERADERRRANKERVDKLIEARAKRRAQLKELLEKRQYEHSLQEEALTERAATDNTEEIDAITDEVLASA